MDDKGKLIFLAFSNPNAEAGGGAQHMACRTCHNKTFVATYDPSSEFPALRCAVCATFIGRFGWYDEREAS